MRWFSIAGLVLLASARCGLGQTGHPSSEVTALAPPSVSEKWHHFEQETFAPLTLGSGAFNAAVSQVTNSTPLYGRDWDAYPERFGSAVGDIVTQNFFGDFVFASAFHEDTRYIRRGPEHRLLPRIAYAISRSVVTRTDAGGSTFNWSNMVGTAASVAVSNTYYPPASRNASAAVTTWGTNVASAGFANLLPEFWPDFHDWVQRKLHRGR